jgi:hypothetical protein
MRKDKILDHDLMPLERIMVWSNRTKLFGEVILDMTIH